MERSSPFRLRALGALLLGASGLAANFARAGMSGDVNAASIANIAFSASNVVSGAVNCATSGSTTMLPWATCPTLAMTIPSLLMSVATAGENADTGTQIDNFKPGTTTGGTTGTTADAPAGPGGGLPTVPTMDWGSFCTKTPDFCNDCAKGGNYASCKPEMIMPDSVDTGMFNTPELQEALAAFEKAAELVNSAPHEGMLADAMGDGSEGDFGFGEGEGAASDPTYVKKSKGLGREDKTGLDRASMWGMDMVDEKTGAKLTLWQRATRRYYGAPDLNRLNFLARAEYIRSRAINHAKTILKDPTRAAKQAAAFAPASSRAPASVGTTNDKSAAAIVPVSPK